VAIVILWGTSHNGGITRTWGFCDWQNAAYLPVRNTHPIITVTFVDHPIEFEFVSRIFASLAVVSTASLVATVVIGMNVDVNDRFDDWKKTRSHESQQRLEKESSAKSTHMMCGVATAIGVLLVSSIAVTYFIGTSRWCREVIEAYSLESDWAARSQSLKRRAFHWALTSMLTVMVIVVFGAAADPATGNSQSESWVVPHFTVALLGVALIGWCFFAMWINILANHAIIASVMNRVEEIREQGDRAV